MTGRKNKFPGVGRTIAEGGKDVAAPPKKKPSSAKVKAPMKTSTKVKTPATTPSKVNAPKKTPAKKPAAETQATAPPTPAPTDNSAPAAKQGRAFTRSQGKVVGFKRPRVVFATNNASRTLLAAVESFAAGIFEDTQASATNARRVTTLPKDMHLSKRIRGERS